MSFWKKAKSELLYTGLDQEQIEQIKAPIAEDNRRSVVSWSVCTAVFWVMGLLISLRSDAYAACRIVYLTALLISILTLVSAAYFVKRFPRLLFATMHLLELSVMGAGIGIAMCQPDVRTVTMIAFAIIIPACIIDSMLTDIVVHVIAFAAYAVLAAGVIEPDVYSWGLMNLVIFSVAGIMVGHVINKARYQRYIYAESAKRLAEVQTKYAYYDQMTGLKNRRAYVEKLEELAKTPPADFCIVMADLNGLKQTNDTIGHEAGDELIIGAAECLTDAFDKRDTIYRIGGDEFCVVMPGAAEETERCLKRLEELTAARTGRFINGVSISCGFAANRDHADIDSIVTQADQNMYEQKRLYYMNHDVDRRKR